MYTDLYTDTHTDTDKDREMDLDMDDYRIGEAFKEIIEGDTKTLVYKAENKSATKKV